ncbi:beta-phosphoglucomutase [Granulicatella sp. HMSC30F09]|uniref:beta-phosphoglucomutase n=1 Tax=Granulicatella sp. HMSC30F09 TaxID=1581071 RepID=UPI0008A32853|nr:beta-phosphoglucomutase [Granulicatella sp. HMSC30F09]OFT80040.1 beta-phosphoglucomutase [Granulicatella sp. HMSC30F09]
MKGVLFDLDGIVTDTATYHFSAWSRLIKDEFGLTLPEIVEERTKGVSREDSLRIILEELDLSLDKDRFQYLTNRKNQCYIESLNQLTSEDILPGIFKLIEELKQKGIKIALASASHNGPFILEKIGLIDSFDTIVDPGKLSRGKPDPEIFEVASAQLGLAPKDCVGIEDSIAGIKAINSAGSCSIGVGDDKLSEAFQRVTSTKELSVTLLQESWNNFVNDKL